MAKKSETINFDTLDKAIGSCRKGLFIMLIVDKKQYKKIRMYLRKYLSYKRGIFTYKGILVLVTEEYPEYKKYFNKIIDLRTDK